MSLPNVLSKPNNASSSFSQDAQSNHVLLDQAQQQQGPQANTLGTDLQSRTQQQQQIPLEPTSATILQSQQSKSPKQNATSSKSQIKSTQKLQLSERDSIFAENYNHDDGADDVIADQGLSNKTLPEEAVSVRPGRVAPSTNEQSKTQQQRSKKMAASPLLPTRIDSPSQKEPFDLFLFQSSHNSRHQDQTISQHTSPASSRAVTPQQILQQRPHSSLSALSQQQHANRHSVTPSSAHIIALPPFSSAVDTPQSRPSTPRTLSDVESGSGIGRSSDERARYRSWREGLPVLGGRVTMGNEDGLVEEEVDKKIEATLPRAEQSTIARSRKSSHMLRIFDKAEPSDDSKQDESSRQVSSEGSGRDRRGTMESRMPMRQPSPVAEEQDYEEQTTKKTRHDKAKGVAKVVDEKKDIFSSHTDQVDQSHNVKEAHLQVNTRTSHQKQQNDEHSPDDVNLSRQSTVSTVVDDGYRELVEKEHVTSAVYYPHRPADPQTTERLRSPSKPRLADDRNDHPQKKKEREQKAHQDTEDRGIELSLQSEDESHYLQGDLSMLTRVSSKESQDHYRSRNDALLSGTESEKDVSEDEQLDLEQPAEQKIDMDDLDINARYAIDLKPFSHQVGGHSSVYRVSRKAICKKVNNKENKFYETVERYHPELLAFMPR